MENPIQRKSKYIRHRIYPGLTNFVFKFLLLLLFLLPHDRVNAQEGLEVIRGEGIFSNKSWIHFTDAPNVLYHHLAGQAHDLLNERAQATNELRTLSSWQERQQQLCETLRDAVGSFPEKTPLNAQVVRIIDKEGYRVEHIIYESQPGFYVTSSLFIPDSIKAKAPAVIYTSGHTRNAYRDIANQHIILNLVKKGFIVFAFDPVGQGERLEYYDPESGKSVLAISTGEHTYSGSQTFITGGSQARYMMWDGIRAVDYLLSREEVDPERIGITGMSGGGTQSAHIAALDERIHAVAPSNYLTSFTRLLESIGPQDAEQTLPSGIKRGIDHADLLSVRAPKPALMLTTTRDAFSIQGARETAREIARIYKAYGMEGQFCMVEDDDGHVVTLKNREAMYGFFQEHLNNHGSPADQETKPLSEQEMQVTSTGQVATSFGGETVFSLNRKEAKKRIHELEVSRQDLPRHLSKVLESARKLSGYQEPVEVDEPVFTGRYQRDGYVVEKYFVKGEGNYPIPYLLMVPDKPTNKGLIYLHPSGKGAEASAGGEMEWFVRRGFMVLAPDIIGTGEVGVGSENSLRRLREWRVSMLIGRSIVGVQAGDVARLTRLLEKNYKKGEVYGVAREEMAPVLLHAAAFDPVITQIILIEPYSSYRSIVMNRFYNPEFIHSTVPGALKAYDLPDLAASLAPRKLIMAGVTDGLGKTTDTENILEDLSFIKAAYKAKKADGQLNIIARESLEKPYDLFIKFIK